MKYYLNEDKTYRPAELMEWAEQFEQMSKEGTRHIANEYVNGKHVSTVGWV